MKIMDIHITILAYFLTDTLDLQVVWGKEKYLKNKVSLKQMLAVKNLSLPTTNK